MLLVHSGLPSDWNEYKRGSRMFGVHPGSHNEKHCWLADDCVAKPEGIRLA